MNPNRLKGAALGNIMVDFQLDEMQTMLKELAHEFAVDEIRPKAEHWDEESVYPIETIRQAHEMGLLNLHIPEAYGGAGLGSLEEVLVNEELAWGDPGFATAAYATALACAPIITGATEEQKNIWLRKVTEEGALASYAITEPGAGSDVAALKTTAISDGDEYVLNGSKMWITGAGYADFFFVLAKTDPNAGYRGMSGFIVEKDTPGFTLGKKETNMGQRCSDTRSPVTQVGITFIRILLFYCIWQLKECFHLLLPVFHIGIVFFIQRICKDGEAHCCVASTTCISLGCNFCLTSPSSAKVL